MKIIGHTDIGSHRKDNQDAFYISPTHNFAVVADGMGGHNGGEVASNAAVTAIRTRLETRDIIPESDVCEELKWAIELANEIVHELGTNELNGMGTTVVVCYLIDNIAYIANVGDSRAYKITADGMEQITSDHSMVNSLLETGKITSNQADMHPQKNVLTRAVGTDRTVDVDTFRASIKKGDCLLLCTDGLTNAISDFEIEQLIRAETTPKTLCELASKRYGKDNITTVIATI
ncbi:MAG: Stp1/IreP family PP2C-type Ser/Thr phosphatase [Clostridiales bacterium]|jgi:protein phosphatase|nr:Stp1/IreP family PP2C-type Ser/Thr phosphatase [Clostridiales bacterium]